MSDTNGIAVTTVERLHELLAEGGWRLEDVSIRLRTASFAFFELDGLAKRSHGYSIVIGRHIDGTTGEPIKGSKYGNGVYGGVTADHLIDVRGIDVPQHLQVPVRGWEDMYLADAYLSRKDRP